MSLVIPTPPTKDTVIGKFENSTLSDIFQVCDSTGAVVCNMNYLGVLNVSAVPVSVAPTVTQIAVSAAQLKGMPTTPVVLIPSPGPGKYIAPQQYTVQYDFGGTHYTVTGNDGVIYTGWGGAVFTTTNTVGSFPDVGFMDQNSSQLFVTSSGMSDPIAISAVVNQPLLMNMINDVLTLGNGTLLVIVSYTIATA